jgi:hypothetical protein
MRVPDELRAFSLYRLDFRALIRERDGNLQTVLIELQKSKQSTDVIRFRNYLAANYHVKKNENHVQEPVAGYGQFYPIVTIYLLGYQLKDLPYMAVKVDRDVVNLSNSQKIKTKSSFIEYLTHQAYIIQLTRLPEKPETPLERLFSLFNQRWRIDGGFAIELPEVPEGFFEMVSYLQQPLLSEEFRNLLDFEYEADVWSREHDRKLKRFDLKMKRLSQEKDRISEEKARISEEKDRLSKEKEEALRNEEKAIQTAAEERMQKENAQKQKAAALENQHKLALKLALVLKNQGATEETILIETGLPLNEILKI